IFAARSLAGVDINGDKILKKAHIPREDMDARTGAYQSSTVVSSFIDYLMKEADKKARDDRAAELAEDNGLPVDHPSIVSAVKDVTGNVDLKLFTDGKGEKLEAEFGKYLRTRSDYGNLNRELFGRFMHGDPQDDFEVIDREEFDRKYAEAAENAAPVSPRPEYASYGDYFEKNKNNLDGTLSKLYHAAKMAAADDLRRNKPDNMFERKVLEDKAKSYMKDPVFKIVMRDEKLVDSVCRGNAERLAMVIDEFKNAIPEEPEEYGPSRETMSRLKGTYELEKKAGNYDPGKLAPKVQEQIKDLSDRMLNIGKYSNLAPEQQYDTAKDPEGLRKKIEQLSGNPTQETINNAAEQYKRESDPKYREMLENADKLIYGHPDQDDYLKTLNSVLEYQNEHLGEKKGAGAQRVNDSMRLLSDMTRGTGLEKYLDQQIDKVNEARHLKPGNRGFLKKEDFTAEAAQTGAYKAEKPDMDLANRINALKFESNDDAEEDEKEEDIGIKLM
ncbi:MAG: hypothetical protein II803_03580, partial [Firmicutes bacterium]|nr:hypothetical protein [Bacillota bacterium]